ncbi:hypothetical protein FS935_08415 [Metabacillus litoralis]|uniref:Double-GTPase 2 domain-containing protein n=1 Tax=Metabacillus litoralis TaxID=152268 RepID=A0A5C6W501_9BACI|nr:hypothetical protein [Metabacillus litoralis]TXC90921.1 hypothetical protein FS935_08415 [Metabacillus litoralis]
MDTYLEKGFRVLNGIVFILSVLIWQFKFESFAINSLLGLVIPAFFILMWGHDKVRRSFISSISFALIVLSLTILPLNMDYILYSLGTVVMIVIASFILRPTLEYIGICLYLFFGFYLFFFVQYVGGIKGLFTSEILALLNQSYYSFEWLPTIMSAKWAILIIAYAIYLAKAALTKEFIRMKLFHIVMSVISFPFLLLPLIISGYIYALYKHVFSYATIFRNTVKVEKNILSTSSQPAYEKYIFKKAFVDAKNVMQTAFKTNRLHVKEIYHSIKKNKNTYGKAIHLFLSIISYSAIFATFTVGNALIAISAAIHFSLLAIYSAPVFAFWTIVYYGDQTYRKINNISTVCSTCYHHSALPTYHCPSCQTAHTLMVPSKFGTLKRKCQCGHKISTSIFNGRSQLDASCHTCSTPIYSSEATTLQIPVIGGTSAGKTSFVMSSMASLINESESKDWTFRYPKAEFKDSIEAFYRNQSVGVRPIKTQSRTPEAQYVGITTKKSKIEKILYLYDPSGETFETSGDFKKQRYLEHYDGLVFVIDPFSIANVRERYQREYNVNAVNPSFADFENIFDRFLIELQESYGIKAHEKITKPIAIVVNKIDQVLKNEVGTETAKQLAATRDDMKNISDATHFLCKEFLASVGMNNFLRKVDNKLSNYQFFAYSSHKKEQTVDHTSEPLLWLLGELHKDLKIINDGK